MSEAFPELVRKLPTADIPVEGLLAYLLQGTDQQVLFMQFDQDAEIPTHAHASQWSIVLRGRIELQMEETTRSYGAGESFFVPSGVTHSARIHAGYADITFFDEKDRYRVR